MDKYIRVKVIICVCLLMKDNVTLNKDKARKDFVEKIGSYSESENEVCDIDNKILLD